MRLAFLCKTILLVLILILTSCTTASNSPPNAQENDIGTAQGSGISTLATKDAPTQSALGVVSTDLVSTLVQLSEVSPFSTTIQVNRPNGEFGDELISALRYSGYGVQIVPDDQGVNYLNYISSFSEEEEGVFYTFKVILRDISVSRSYVKNEEFFIPSSPVRIKGVEPQRIIVNDDLYRHSIGNAEFPSGVTFTDSNGRLIYNDPRLVVSTNAMKRNTNDQIKPEIVLIHARANLFTKSRVTPPKVKRSYEPYKQVSLRFKPNSLDLGMKNKSAIGQLLESFDESTDRLSITACSFGKSLIWDGTESVSLERGLRVRQELLASNVSIDNTRDESCFSTKYGDDLPRRTVILTLERAVRIL